MLVRVTTDITAAICHRDCDGTVLYIHVGVGTMGALWGWCPPMFSDSYVARLNLYTLINTALAYRSIESPFTKPSSYASDYRRGGTGFVQDRGYSREEPGRPLSHVCPGRSYGSFQLKARSSLLTHQEYGASRSMMHSTCQNLPVQLTCSMLISTSSQPSP